MWNEKIFGDASVAVKTLAQKEIKKYGKKTQQLGVKCTVVVFF